MTEPKEQYAEFLRVLDDPPPPDEKLVAMMARYKLATEARVAAQRLEAREEISEAMVERVAEAAFLEFWRGMNSAVDRRFWCTQNASTRDLWIRVQRAALEAAKDKP